MQDWMKNYSLNQIEKMYHEGVITKNDVEEYIKAWNETPGRFTTATFSGYNIYNK